MIRQSTTIRTVDGADLAFAFVLAAIAFVSFCAFLPTTQYGDGPQLISLVSSFDFGPAIYRHAGYLQVVDASRRALEWMGVTPHAGMLLQLFSAFWASVGLGTCWLILRQLGLPRASSLAAVALLAFAPVMTFYARVAEVHTLHFANVALVILALIGVGRKVRSRAAGVLVLGAASAFLTHQTAALLIPGLVAFATWVRGEMRDWRSWLIFGVCGAVGLAIGIAATLWIRGDSLTQLFGGTERQVINDLQLDRLQFVLQDLLLPILVLWPFILVGLARLRRAELGLFVGIALACGIEISFFAWWSVSERGAYMTGYLPLLLIPAAFGIEMLRAELSTSKRALMVAAFMVQAGVGLFLLERFEASGDPSALEKRFQIVDAALIEVPGPKVLLTIDPSRQTPAAVVDDLLEKKLVFEIDAAFRAGLTPEEFGVLVRQAIPSVVGYRSELGARVFFDRTYREFVEFSGPQKVYVEAFEVAMCQEIKVESIAEGQLWELIGVRADL